MGVVERCLLESSGLHLGSASLLCMFAKRPIRQVLSICCASSIFSRFWPCGSILLVRPILSFHHFSTSITLLGIIRNHTRPFYSPRSSPTVPKQMEMTRSLAIRAVLCLVDRRGAPMIDIIFISIYIMDPCVCLDSSNASPFRR